MYREIHTHAAFTGTETRQSHSITHVSTDTLAEILKDFFELESVPKCEEKAIFNDKSNKLLRNSTKRNSEDRYVLKLPFKEV